jgi:hypothetical protein
VCIFPRPVFFGEDAIICGKRTGDERKGTELNDQQRPGGIDGARPKDEIEAMLAVTEQSHCIQRCSKDSDGEMSCDSGILGAG